MKQFFLLLYLAFSITFAKAQNESGFRDGDIELIRFFERKLLNQTFNDTVSYLFTAAVLEFDDEGELEKVFFLNDNELKLTCFLSTLFLETKKMWDTTLTKKQILLIPFEIFKITDDGDLRTIQNKRIFSEDYLSFFRGKTAINVKLLRPIVSVIE